MAASTHRWKFFRAGGVDQVTFRSGADITELGDLNQKLWIALACPTRGLELDPKTLDLIDADKDGRIRAPEVIAAVKWVKETFKNPDDLLKGGDSVPLSAMNEQTEKGALLLAGARRILQNLGKGAETSISLADAVDTEKIFAATKFNGDGVVPADSSDDERVRKTIQDIIAIVGETKDRSGKPGVNQAQVDAFFAEAEAFAEWHGKSEADKNILPLGDKTAKAADAVRAVKAKVEDYFARCRLASFDGRAAALMNGSESEFQALSSQELTAGTLDIARLPLAKIEANKALSLADGVNPAWSEPLATLARDAIAPLLGPGKTTLTEADWVKLQGRLTAYTAWIAAKPEAPQGPQLIEPLGIERVRALLVGKIKEAISSLIQQDLALEAENAQIAEVERFIRYQRDLVALLNNFVNFSAFYGKRDAVFQAGTLYLDGRSCNLCLRVEDAARHATLAGLSKSYLAYCDCSRLGGEKMVIVAAFTNGDSDNLMVGRNGVFYDRKGQDWDATITKIIENPISVRQAFWAPYKRFVRMVDEQVAKRAAAADADAGSKLAATATATAHADKTPAPARPAAKTIDVGTVAAIGVAVGGIATFLSSILATFFGLGLWMPAGLFAIVLGISGASMLVAWLKLRQRNLGPLLDASGWAVNGRVKVNVPFGGALTDVATVPRGSERSLRDPYAEKRSPWRFYAFLLFIAALALSWYRGKLDAYLPPHVRSVTVLVEVTPTRPGPAAAPADKK